MPAADPPLSSEVEQLLNETNAARLQDIAHAKLMAELFEQMIEASPRGHVVVDPAGRIVYLNRSAEQMFGWVRADLVGQELELLLEPELRAKHVEHRARYMLDPRIRPMGIGLDTYGLRHDGARFPINVMLSALTVSTGIYYRAIVTPIVEELDVPRPKVPVPEKPRILVVEDDPDVATMMVEGLIDAHYEPVLAVTGEAAIARLEQGGFVLAIIDLGLPDVTGTKVATLMRAKGNTCPMIAVSGLVSDIKPEVLARGGFAEAMQKPISVAALLEAVERHRLKE